MNCRVRRRKERAQAMTEMLVIITAIVIGTGVVMAVFLDHVGTFHTRLIHLIAIPIP